MRGSRLNEWLTAHTQNGLHTSVHLCQGFRWVLPYSPLHNVAPPADGGQYPALLLTTADHDDRVVPLHSHKLIATLQHDLAGEFVLVPPGVDVFFFCGQRTRHAPAAVAAGVPNSPQRNPLITRIEVRAGHGAGKPTSKIIAETSDMLAFAAKACGVSWQAKSNL